MNNPEDKPILILGMHRSGTSYLAQLMQALGVFIGDDLVGPQKGNLRGHFESRGLLEFHESLIANRDTSQRKAFDEGMLVQAPLSQTFSEEERKAAMELITASRRPGYWGWKEPRTCLFLDLWMDLLPDAQTLVVYRHPLEVQQSMLRRGHWDLALFQDQAMQSYVVYNEALLEKAASGYVFNANAGFGQLSELARELKDHFNLPGAGELPPFHAEEFQALKISRSLHGLFALFHPQAAGVFDRLQAIAARPFVWEEREDDAILQQLTESLKPLLEGVPASARAYFIPLLDWWASEKDRKILPLYEELAREIGEHIRSVKDWNEKAAKIFEENKRLAADYESMGKAYAKQQEEQARFWVELKRTGDSWKEQRDFIDNLLKEKRVLLEELQQLKDKLAAKGNKD